MKRPHVVSVFKPLDNRRIVVEKRKTKTIYCPAAELEDYRCSCGFETEEPFDMLFHLRDVHKVSSDIAIAIFNARSHDLSQTYMEVKKGEPIPKGIKVVEMG